MGSAPTVSADVDDDTMSACTGEEDHNSYDIERLKKPVEVDSSTVSTAQLLP